VRHASKKMDNRISFKLNDADKQAIMAAISVLTDVFLRRMQYPEFAAVINVPEFEKDVNTVGLLREFYVPLSQLAKQVYDTMTLGGSEAYT
jgi:hypothetical protein